MLRETSPLQNSRSRLPSVLECGLRYSAWRATAARRPRPWQSSCSTDLTKISTGSHSAPRIFGHETSGMIVAVGEGVTNYSLGERVMVFHHIPCRSCFYCNRKVFAQCPVYKKVGVTAGYEPSGGGFAEYVRVMDWIVQRGGVVRIPQQVSYEQAAFIEPVNTCQKGIETLRLEAGETVLVIGQDPSA